MDADYCPYLYGYVAFCSDLPCQQLNTSFRTFRTGYAIIEIITINRHGQSEERTEVNGYWSFDKEGWLG